MISIMTAKINRTGHSMMRLAEIHARWEVKPESNRTYKWLRLSTIQNFAAYKPKVIVGRSLELPT